MSITLTIEILPVQRTIYLDVDPYTEVCDLLEYIQEQEQYRAYLFLRINSDTKDWTCYSELKRMFLIHHSCFGNANNDKLTINTSPNTLPNTSPNTSPNQKQIQQFSYNQQDSSQKSQQYYIREYNGFEVAMKPWELVVINFEITNGDSKCQLQCTYRGDDILDAFADTVLAYLRVSKQRASCDLFFKGGSINNYNSRIKQICKAYAIESGITVQARLRWIKSNI
ncbi:unnamed protein product (macronuclear) [Paramecium tetraurelia]|uniref:Uncharacterized protein n=1 Tax=Paramecium tetraurelia TaxID=5888 RepID=A0DD00_PARTE|nr:uncharacterized protein GSPATT00015776001 [Paramecium tetraurelia]CAK80917.1 unnamed protein product [Paramecium tetraurelia]|eukprot:XP_001448314.1 hypothetical protein (macronuclear) [Paramecium tetraurelia strain d4-2]